MLKEKLEEEQLSSPDFLYDRNWLSWWFLRGNAWNSQIEREYWREEEPPIDKSESTPQNNLLFYGIMTSLLLLSAAALSQVPQTSQTMEEAKINSAKQMLMNY